LHQRIQACRCFTINQIKTIRRYFKHYISFHVFITVASSSASHLIDADGESFDEYSNDGESFDESNSSYAADSPRDWKESENERNSRGIAYQEEATSFGMEDDYSRTSPNISGDRYGFGGRLSRKELPKAAAPREVSEQRVLIQAAETPSVVLEQEVNTDLIVRENFIPEKNLN